jgi:uncharacterized membrane protein YiaA
MSSREYLHEKAEESRHNETIAYLMFLAGAVFFIGGVMTNLSLGKDFSWFLIIPYRTEPLAGALLGLALTVCGVFLVVVGMAAGVHYSRDRGWYMQEMRKANSPDEAILNRKSGKNTRKKKTG